MKRLLSTAAAILFAGGFVYASNIPLSSGPVDAGNLLGSINQLIQGINTNVNGQVAVITATAASTATSAEQNLASVAIPASTLTRAGQALRVRCSGLTAANAGTKLIKVYYGTSSYSSPSIATGSQFDLELMVTYAASATNQNLTGRGSINQVGGPTSFLGIAPTSATATADDVRTNLNARCTTTQGNASAADTTLINFMVEQLK